MAANKKPKNEDFEKALKYLEKETRRLTELSKNLSESWKNGDREWVPMYLLEQTNDIEEKMKQIRSLIRVPRENIEDATNDTVQGTCQEHQEQIKQLKKNNETLLQNNQTLEKELRDLKKELKKEEIPPVIQPSLQVEKQEKKPVSTFKVPQGEEVLNSPENAFLNKMLDFESKSNKEKADLKSENGKLSEKINTLKRRIQELENEKSQLTERSSATSQRPGSGTKKTERKQNEKQQDNMGKTHRNETDAGKDRSQVTVEKKNETKEQDENESFNADLDALKNNPEQQDENINPQAENKGDESGKKDISLGKQGQKQECEETKTNNLEPTKHEQHNANDSAEEKWKHRCREIEKEKRQLIENRDILQAQNVSLETYTKQLKEEKDELLLRLSKFAGNKLVENNPAITDLSDSNRPTKLAEYFSELYDNEWTDAFEALKTAGYEEITAIETLRLTLENVLQFCAKKAELLLRKASDAVNLLFEEYQQSIMEMKVPSHLTIPRQNALSMGKHLRREQSSLDDIKLQHMWKPKTEKGGQKSCSENVNETENIKIEAENKLKTLRKEMASTMVPIVQKAYMEASWSKQCIDEIKPFILKCLYLGWMMKVQSPPMVFHKCDMEARFDKNLYKEYLTSGQLVSFVVWPALLLHDSGPIVCKGVAEGKKI
ncbi:golgin subfamily A member 6-like protein 7 [Ruditapes philippinarum]|uniref:golgin subfamily A member 6-like protein 7 n=1 Tax=Ruditapes philippinarum TaxID=129788 RepID=UPI00295C0857|nr:golgin subfamily A member 6-like protein 7 [Ruditapes philippinarum]XP_060601836.1 golgin subfamily A member 6-like protein 7 [Ruditapes philippinarum]